MRFHILGVAHSITSHERGQHENPTDAFVNCTIYLASLLHRAGHEVYVYAVESSVVRDCTELVDVVSRATYDRVYEHRDNTLVNTFSDCDNDAWSEFTARCSEAIRENREPDDVILPMFGAAHEPTTRVLDNAIVVEPCIGHPGAYAPYRVYCSYAWYYTDLASKGFPHGHAYWSVIPHFLPPSDFPFQPTKRPDTCVYIGRIQPDKGVEIAVEVTRRLKLKLIVIGNGRLDEHHDHVEHLGVLSLHDKVGWLGSARCVFVPTLYMEPFSFAALESQMCGTPVLCSRWEVPRRSSNTARLDTIVTPSQLSLEDVSDAKPWTRPAFAERRYGLARTPSLPTSRLISERWWPWLPVPEITTAPSPTTKRPWGNW